MNTAVAVPDQATVTRLPSLPAGGPVRPIVPQDFEGAWRIASAVCKARMAPRGLEAPEQAMVAIMHGLEVGLTPMNALQSIAVVNGRPTVWGDGAIALVRGSGLLEWMEEKYEGQEGSDAFKAVCLVKRKGEPKPVRGEFSVADAKKAGLWGKSGPWQQYPKRMLQMRARAFALRDGFADVLKGLSIKEEVEDYHNGAAAPERELPPAPPPVAQVEHQPQESVNTVPVSGPVEDLVEVKAAEAETVEWSEDGAEPRPDDQPPVPPAAETDPPAPPTSVKASDVDDSPGDRPMSAGDGLDIPPYLRREPKPAVPARAEPAADTFDVEEWLKGLSDELAGCEGLEELTEIQQKRVTPLKGKVAKADFARAHTLIMETFDRISGTEEGGQ